MTKMFGFVDETWNPIAMRCKHHCNYCWAAALIDGKLKETPRYMELSEPRLIEAELHRSFKEGTCIFVEDMGDLFGSWIPIEWIAKVFKVIKKFPQTRFLLMTKNPARYISLRDFIPWNVLLGATIETNRDTSEFSQAPPTRQRWEAMLQIDYPHKFISVEPIMDFDLHEFADWLYSIGGLEMVAIGYDNYNHHLPEPSLEKTKELITRLSRFTRVIPKTLREVRE